MKLNDLVISQVLNSRMRNNASGSQHHDFCFLVVLCIVIIDLIPLLFFSSFNGFK